MAAAAASSKMILQPPVRSGREASVRTPVALFRSSPPLFSRNQASIKHSTRQFVGLKAAGQYFSSNFSRGDSYKLLEASVKTSQRKTLSKLTCSPGQARIVAYKVAVLGAAGGIGQPLSLLLKMSPLLSNLNLYDIANVKGVVADLGHCNTPAQKETTQAKGKAVLDWDFLLNKAVSGFTGPAELADSLKGVDLIIIPAGVPRKPGMTRDDLFNINAGIVKDLVEVAADTAPNALINVISNPVNSTVPIAAEILKQKGVYNPRKLFGVTTLDVVRANTFVAKQKNLRLIDVDVPVIGGHAGITILPLLSKARPAIEFSTQEIEELTVRIQNAGTEVVEAKAGAGSATLSMAYAGARFAESCIRALDGDPDVYECSYVQSELTELPFFASRLKLGKEGIEAFVHGDLNNLTEYEQKALEALKPELKASIQKGIEFVNRESAPLAV
ncbi:hypothetical protein O6H91_02G074300 [Diphasiastrum complanatum]|uniref:Uncharacterized protein n=1 Tax=Diphasiastrum complanatum TaxID=34168 RepID=A0ACC2EGZ5_DIPCM|nr:hypothetical protein O6H91_02G074300 [Diphasiastrum complanatum]